MRKALTELDLKKIKRLESGSIFGSRETMAYNDNPALLYSIYKDGLTPFSDNTNGYSSVATIIDF